MAEKSKVSVRPLGAQSLGARGGKPLLQGPLGNLAQSMGSAYQKLLGDMAKYTKETAQVAQQSQADQQSALRDIVNQGTRRAEQERAIESRKDAREHSASLNAEAQLLAEETRERAVKELAHQNDLIAEQDLLLTHKLKEYHSKRDRMQKTIAMGRQMTDALQSSGFRNISALRWNLPGPGAKLIKGQDVIRYLRKLWEHAAVFDSTMDTPPAYVTEAMNIFAKARTNIRQGKDYPDLATYKPDPYMIPVSVLEDPDAERPYVEQDLFEFRKKWGLSGGVPKDGIYSIDEDDPLRKQIDPYRFAELNLMVTSKAVERGYHVLEGRHTLVNDLGRKYLKAGTQVKKYTEFYEQSVKLYTLRLPLAVEQAMYHLATKLDTSMDTWQNPQEVFMHGLVTSLMGSEEAATRIEGLADPHGNDELVTPGQGMIAMNGQAVYDVINTKLMGTAAESKGARDVVLKVLAENPDLRDKFMLAMPQIGEMAKGFARGRDTGKEPSIFNTALFDGIVQGTSALAARGSMALEAQSITRQIQDFASQSIGGIDTLAAMGTTYDDITKTIHGELDRGESARLPTVDEMEGHLSQFDAFLTRMDEYGIGPEGFRTFFDDLAAEDKPDPVGNISKLEEFWDDPTLKRFRDPAQLMFDKSDRIRKSTEAAAQIRMGVAPREMSEKEQEQSQQNPERMRRIANKSFSQEEIGGGPRPGPGGKPEPYKRNQPTPRSPEEIESLGRGTQ